MPKRKSEVSPKDEEVDEGRKTYGEIIYYHVLQWRDSAISLKCLYVHCRGSAATGLVCAICAAQGDSFLGLSSNLYILGFVASLATKLADTFASEIGKAYGKTTFLITTLERVEPGTEGRYFVVEAWRKYWLPIPFVLLMTA